MYLPSDCYISVYNNQLCEEYHYDCIDYWGEQDQSNCCEGENGEPNWTGCFECSEGDINGDFTIDVLDVVVMVNCILMDDCDDCSDITSDGETNVLDIVYLINYILEN